MKLACARASCSGAAACVAARPGLRPQSCENTAPFLIQTSSFMAIHKIFWVATETNEQQLCQGIIIYNAF